MNTGFLCMKIVDRLNEKWLVERNSFVLFSC